LLLFLSRVLGTDGQKMVTYSLLVRFAAVVVFGGTLSCAAAQDPVPKQPQPIELTEKAAKERAAKAAGEWAKEDAERAEARRKADEWDARNPSAYALEQMRRQQVGLTLFWLALLCSLAALVAPWFMVKKGRWPMAVTASGLTMAGTVFPALHIWFGNAGHELLINGLLILLSWVLSIGLIAWAGVAEVRRVPKVAGQADRETGRRAVSDTEIAIFLVIAGLSVLAYVLAPWFGWTSP
jgi:hypothetical protein